MMKTVYLSVLALVAMVSTKGLAPIPDRVYVGLRAFDTPADAATREGGGASAALRVGGEGTAYVLSGELDPHGRPIRDRCSQQTGSGALDTAAAAKSANVWRAKLNVLSATMESIVIGVDWSRDSVNARGVRSRAAGDRRTVTLREGERHTLDYLASPEASDGCPTSLRVDLEATIAEDPRFVGQRIQYDLWLIDETAEGVRETREFVAAAAHGEKIAFTLDPLRWELGEVRFRNGEKAQAVASIRGSIRGRLRDDGSVEVMFEATRAVGITEAGKPLRGSTEDGGEKALRIGSGETLGLVLPAADGAATLALDETWSSVVDSSGKTSGGIEVDSERVKVDFAKFLAGHKMSFRLTASKVSR